MKFFIDVNGVYLGEFDEKSKPVGAIEVQEAPNSARDKFINGLWVQEKSEKVRVVTMRQARLALLEKGYLSQVEPIIDQLPEEQKQAALIEWEFAGTVDRQKQLTRFLVDGLNLTEQQEDELFELAATL